MPFSQLSLDILKDTMKWVPHQYVTGLQGFHRCMSWSRAALTKWEYLSSLRLDDIAYYNGHPHDDIEVYFDAKANGTRYRFLFTVERFSLNGIYVIRLDLHDYSMSWPYLLDGKREYDSYLYTIKINHENWSLFRTEEIAATILLDNFPRREDDLFWDFY